MIQNLKSNFIVYVITIKWIRCVQGKIELSSMSQGQKSSSTKVSRDLSLATKIKQQ